MEEINIWEELTELMFRDEWYHQCAQQVTEADFMAIRDLLTKEQQYKIDAYLAALTAQDNCLVHLAYRLGKNSAEKKL